MWLFTRGRHMPAASGSSYMTPKWLKCCGLPADNNLLLSTRPMGSIHAALYSTLQYCIILTVLSRVHPFCVCMISCDILLCDVLRSRVIVGCGANGGFSGHSLVVWCDLVHYSIQYMMNNNNNVSLCPKTGPSFEPRVCFSVTIHFIQNFACASYSLLIGYFPNP